MRRLLRFFSLGALALLTLILALWLTQPRLTATIVDPAGQSQSTDLPWRFNGEPNERVLHVRFSQPLALADRWRIIPDDELLALRVNGQPVPLDKIPPASLRDWNQGFAIGLAPWLRRGENHIELKVHNGGGPGGIALRPQTSFLGMVLLAIPCLLWLAALTSLLRLTRGQIGLLLLALLVLLAYWSVTPWEIRAHDVGLPGGHFGYASYIADHLALPRPNAGWTFYHPQLYYILSAVMLKTADLVGFARAESLQFFSLELWLCFLVAGCATLRIALRGRDGWLLVASAALVLWPSGIIHSIRIGNDVPTYACCALATYCMLRWWKRHSMRSLLGMAIWAALALLCKTSAVTVAAAGGLLLSWRILFPGAEGRLCAFGRTVLFGLVTSTGLALSLAANIYFYLKGELSSWLVGNVGGLTNTLRVPADLKAFIPLDVPTFLTSPWASAWDDKLGRLNFWNYLLRNSLTGEFQFQGTGQQLIAWIWGFCLLLVCAQTVCFTAGQLQHGRQRWFYRQRPLLILCGLWLASLMALRIQAPYACSNDFRYIVPVLLPAIVLAVQAGKTTRVLLLSISLMSVYFFVSL